MLMVCTIVLYLSPRGSTLPSCSVEEIFSTMFLTLVKKRLQLSNILSYVTGQISCLWEWSSAPPAWVQHCFGGKGCVCVCAAPAVRSWLFGPELVMSPDPPYWSPQGKDGDTSLTLSHLTQYLWERKVGGQFAGFLPFSPKREPLTSHRCHWVSWSKKSTSVQEYSQRKPQCCFYCVPEFECVCVGGHETEARQCFWWCEAHAQRYCISSRACHHTHTHTHTHTRARTHTHTHTHSRCSPIFERKQKWHTELMGHNWGHARDLYPPWINTNTPFTHTHTHTHAFT